MKDYLVIYEQADDGGWGAHSPDGQGVVERGERREEAEARRAEALGAHLAYLRGVRPARSGAPHPRRSRRRVAAPDARVLSDPRWSSPTRHRSARGADA